MNQSSMKIMKCIATFGTALIIMLGVNLYGEGAGSVSAKLGAPNLRVMNQSSLEIKVALEASKDATGNIKQRYSPRVFNPLKGGKAATTNASEAGGDGKFHVGFQGAKMQVQLEGGSFVHDFDGSNSFNKTYDAGGNKLRVQGRWTPAVWVIQIQEG